MMNNKQTLKIMSVYSVSHAIVDFCCSAIIYSFAGNISAEILLQLVIVYNSLAFGLQSFIGFLADKFQNYKTTAILGCLFLIAGICIYKKPMLTIIIMGIGNAMFHAGGGAISMKIGQGKASLPGIFVAPGAVGLFLGTLWWKIPAGNDIWLAFLPLFALAFLIFTDIPEKENKNIDKINISMPVYVFIIILILAAVAIRSFIGLSYDFSGKGNFYLVALFVCFSAAGKFAGGFLADRFGMFNTAVIGLLLSIPLLKFGFIPQSAMLGMFFFNLTMPITVTALGNMMPNLKGFAFGLTTLALLIGFLPVFTEYKVAQSLFFFEIIFISIIITAVSLKLYEKLFNRS